jgi:hypothetical protein
MRCHHHCHARSGGHRRGTWRLPSRRGRCRAADTHAHRCGCRIPHVWRSQPMPAGVDVWRHREKCRLPSR